MDDYLKEYVIEENHKLHIRNTLKNTTEETIIAKVVAMCCLFCGSFFLGILPIKLSQWFKWESNTKRKKFATTLLCLGGGVLLCTIFFHLQPELSQSIDKLIAEGHFPDTGFSFAEILMCIGFFALYFVEECVHLYIHKKEKGKKMSTFERTLSIRRGEIPLDTDSVADTSSNSSANLVKVDEERGQNFTKHEHNPHHDNHAGHSHIILEDEDSIVKSIRGLLVVLALSVHELFEGLTVGLESSSSSVWYMFAAVSAHKFVIAFCIGIELVTNKTKTFLNVIYVFIFSIVSPLGIGIGLAITVDKEDSTTLVSVILQGLASGTLLYVVFFEILQKDKASGLIRYCAVLIGFLLMIGLTILTVLALSFHAVFEGLAVGLEGNVQKVWYLFAAIATHKLVIAFCVGVELAVSHTKTVLLIIYIGTFAVVTPLGIGVGLALSENGDGTEEGIVSVILQGMAAGTLLYVVFFEVLARERNNHHSGIWQLIAIIAGFGIMLGLQFFTGHEHGHGPSNISDIENHFH